ncbi:TRAP transporter large permease subunit [Arenibaculum sp.]|uniref:TRAP transporter large permease n=1 Tax=Arenibaculum sp. TaxID=2865862 RepID=UPI002E122AF4|nr:TRAP transporter large permease subunit [Arenibaculum sp.]
MDHAWPLAMLALLFVGIFAGYPVAFVLAGTGVAFTFLADIPLLFLSLGVSRIYSGTLTNWLLIAVPLFVFMGLMLERSGVAARLLRSMAGLFGPLPGGYAVAVTLIGVIMAASTGIIGASVVLMGLLALPAMLANGYDARVSTGLIAASGTLGILLPPSIMLIILGDTLRISVGDLFMGAVFPGLLLAGLYLAYIVVLGLLRPRLMPPLPRGDSVGLGRRLADLARDLLAPLALIVTVLGSIIAGIATPTESAALGAVGALVLALAAPDMSWRSFADALRESTKTSAMIIFVMIGATIFSVVFKRLGGDGLIESLLGGDDAGPYQVLFMIMLLVFVLGMFLEWVEITLVVLPLVAPVIAGLDFGMTESQTMLWFAVLFAVNLQTSFLTPPFGYALFYIRGIAPEGVTIGDIYRGIVPFVAIQLAALGLAIAFPQIVTWLPERLLVH